MYKEVDNTFCWYLSTEYTDCSHPHYTVAGKQTIFWFGVYLYGWILVLWKFGSVVVGKIP